VRLDFERDECVLSYSVDAVVRGRGWGGWLVAEAMKGVRPSRCRVMRADVREANTASRRVFRRLGWQEAENADGRVEFSWSTAAGGVGESR
jgi:L-amino acid N-acyltransferase YncA